MRKLITILAVCLMAYAAQAQPRHIILSVSPGTNATAVVTNTTIAGYVDEIILELPSGALTGTVAVAVSPPLGSARTLASKAITAHTIVRYRLDGTGTDGTALTDDPPDRYLSYGDTWTMTVSSMNVTGKTWRAYIKYDDWK